MKKAGRYRKQLFWDEEDEGFIAIAPDLLGCSVFGETEQEALSELADAIIAWINAAQAAGNIVPKPSRQPVNKLFSGSRG